MNDNFKYHNENPYRIEENDCVCRALTRALNLRYETAEELLSMSAKVNNCDTLCVCCYHHLLEDVFHLPVRKCNNWERVKDIARSYPNNRVLIRIDGHLTVSDCGTIYDLWDCSQRLVDCYWIVP